MFGGLSLFLDHLCLKNVLFIKKARHIESKGQHIKIKKNLKHSPLGIKATGLALDLNFNLIMTLKETEDKLSYWDSSSWNHKCVYQIHGNPSRIFGGILLYKVTHMIGGKNRFALAVPLFSYGKSSCVQLGITLGVAHRSELPPSAELKVQTISTLTSVATELLEVQLMRYQLCVV